MQVFLRKYGAAARVLFHLFEVDGVDFRVDAVCTSTDCVINKDEASAENTVNKFVDIGKGYYQEYSPTEMTCARALVSIADAATKAWLDMGFVIETYGNASAQHAMDFDTPVPAMRGTDSGLLATAGAAIKADTAAIVTASAAIKSVVDAIPTTAMRGTDDGALATAAAAIQTAVDAIPTTAMRGTDSALLATAGAAIKSDTTELVTASAAIKSVVDAIPTTAMRGTDSALLATAGAAIKSVVDAIPTTAMRGTDSALLATAGAAIKAETAAIVSATSGIRTITDALPNSGALTINGVGYDVALTEILAYCNGKIAKVGNAYEYKKRDNSTKAFINTVSTSSRVRS